MIKTILLDMDCVLANFICGLAQLYGTTQEHLESYQPIGVYDYRIAISKYQSACEDIPEQMMTQEYWWKIIESKVGFWAELPEFTWTRELLDLVRSITDNWYVVSSPSRCPRCIPEKRQWLHRVLDVEWYDRLIPTPHKELMAKPGVVLIDDYEVNCRKFDKEGGTGVIFPAHHNQWCDAKRDPMPVVKSTLSYIRSL